MRGSVAWAALVGCIAMLPACKRSDSAAPSTPPSAPPVIGAGRDVPAEVVPDEAIVRTTRRELGRDPVTGGENIGVDSEHGVLTLQGPLGNRLAKRRAVEIAHVVRGVRALVDRTQVTAPQRPDFELDAAVAAALSRDPVTAGEPIAAHADRGVVRLTGRVASPAALRAAEADTLAVPGVLDVAGALTVVPRQRSDARLTAEVERTTRDDPWLDGSHVRADVRSGAVSLAGYVGSAGERARAEEDAWLASPAAVNAAALVIDQFVDDGTLRAAPRARRLDGDLEQSLLDAYVRDPRVHPFSPTVDVRDGVVVLSGVAPNPLVARAVDEDARVLPGVTGVLDEVRTLPGVFEQSDAAIRDQIVKTMSRDPRLAASVSVEVVAGRVFLRGTVANDDDRLRAVGIASSAPGARNVEDGLVVTPSGEGVTNPQPP
jgi:hyperosmotically inducible protein